MDLNKTLQELIMSPNMSGAAETAAKATGYVTLDGKEFEIQVILTQNPKHWIGAKQKIKSEG